MKNNIKKKKIELRKIQIKIRKKLYLSVPNSFKRNLFDKFFNKIKLNRFDIISSFISIKSEINTNELNNYILNKNKILCLPVVIKKNNHLIFREFTDDKEMITGFLDIKEPTKSNQTLIPNILIVPCLAFDSSGYRLGYGGGYYDRTFSYLKNKNHKYISIGYAFDGQKVPSVPKDEFDIKLDYVITEKKIYSFI